MRFLIKPHQNKEVAYRQALLDAGHEESRDADVVLIDFEIPHPPYQWWVDYANNTGAALVAYPPGFALVGEHQLTREPHKCAAAFVHGPGQKHLRELYEYPNPVHAVGYPGRHNPLVAREPRVVVFAPHHPLGSGWMPTEARRHNTHAFRMLLKEDFDLTVRMIGNYEQNGIWHEDGVRYVQGRMDGTIEPCDVAVAGGTYAANCLAAGRPVVMYNQSREWTVELEGQTSRKVFGWTRHAEFTHYPYDLEPGVVAEAAANPDPPEVREWMARFMPSFEPTRFVRLVEEAVERTNETPRPIPPASVP